MVNSEENVCYDCEGRSREEDSHIYDDRIEVSNDDEGCIEGDNDTTKRSEDDEEANIEGDNDTTEVSDDNEEASIEGDNVHNEDEEVCEDDEEKSSEDIDNNADVDEELFVGKKYPCFEVMYLTLQLHGWRNGIQWRIRSSRQDCARNTVNFCFICKKEGKLVSRGRSLKKPIPSMKEGCLACVTSYRQIGEEWEIKSMNLEHSHTLDPTNSPYLSWFRHIPPHIRHLITKNDRSGIGLSRSYTSINACHEDEGCWTALERDCRNYLRQERKLFLGKGDANALMEYFTKMQAENSNFYYNIDVDEEGKLRNVFWADARSRTAYEEFNDVITFDTTYHKNKYRMSFVPFVSMNHHGKTIMLGSALLSSKDEETFKWVFKIWLFCMRGVAPKAIITDQDKAMAATIEEVFPKTTHRLCIWHILKKFEQKVGKRRRNFKEIHKEMISIVYDTY